MPKLVYPKYRVSVVVSKITPDGQYENEHFENMQLVFEFQDLPTAQRLARGLVLWAEMVYPAEYAQVEEEEHARAHDR